MTVDCLPEVDDVYSPRYLSSLGLLVLILLIFLRLYRGLSRTFDRTHGLSRTQDRGLGLVGGLLEASVALIGAPALARVPHVLRLRPVGLPI